MGKPQKISLKEAANLIQDGDFLAFSGFTIWRRPMALIYEMVRQGKKICIYSRLMEALTLKFWLVPEPSRCGSPAGLDMNFMANWVKV
jgi:hypothetical protein